MNKLRPAFQILFVIFTVYFFICSIQLMGVGFKSLGKGFGEALIKTTTNPLAGLFIGLLVTSMLQSSSCTTSITVSLVAAGSLTLHNAIPIVMGANIGTTITNTLVSWAHITRKEEFSRAFAGSVVHDVFNILSVIILFPLEIRFHFIEKLAKLLTNIFMGIGGIHIMDPLKLATKPVVKLFKYILGNHPILIIIIGVGLLFFSLFFIVKLVRALIGTKIEIYINEAVFYYPFRAFIAGLILTTIVQSSSVTTSIIVPLVGAGILTVENIFPYTMGANIGTTITAILAALATANPLALTAAFSHLSFNCIGSAIFYPLRKIPITLAKLLSIAVSKRRFLALVYVGVVFFIIPIILIFLGR